MARALGDGVQRMKHMAARDDHARAGSGGDLGRRDLRFHAAFAQSRYRTLRHRLDLGRDRVHFCNMARLRIALRIGGVEPVDVGEEHKQIGFHHRRHARSQPVIIAIAQFGRRNRVVLVDHRHGVESDQGAQCFARIQIAAAFLGVFRRQQNLRHRQAMHVKGIDIGLAQTNLPRGRGRLAFFETQRSRFQPERAPPERDRAGGDENDFLFQTVSVPRYRRRGWLAIRV